MFEALAGQYFDRAFRKMVTAFETRAEDLYGKQKLERAKRRLIAARRCDPRPSKNFDSASRSSLSRTARANTTVPTGFCSLPPSGPAMPLIATATSALLFVSAPWAMA